MTEFKPGDIVRMTRGEPDTPGYRVEVRSVTEGISESPEVNFRLLKTFENAGWKIELIERPAASSDAAPFKGEADAASSDAAPFKGEAKETT